MVAPGKIAPPPSHTPWLQHVVAAAVTARTLQVSHRLRYGDPGGAQHRVWRNLMERYASTAFGLGQGIRAAMPYEEFRRRIPLRDYERFVPWIERMKRGETSVLWPGRCANYAVSSGTTAGRTKFLPITSEMLAHFRRAGLDSLCYYARRTGSAAIFRGRQLFLGGSTALTTIGDLSRFPARAGDLSGISALNLPRWAEEHWYEPGREIAQLSDWPTKLRAIAARTIPRDIRLLAGIPSWMLGFAETVRAETGRSTLREVWPRLECVVHGGVPLAPFADELRRAVGPDVNFHEVYPASEGFIAAQDDEPAAGLRLLTDVGLFFEFLPMTDFDETRLEQLGAAAVPLEGVRTGADYALVLTTPAGLCRYVIGDVVRFTSTRPPRLVYVGRTRLQLSAFGEHVIEKEATDALTTVCARAGTTIVNFHVAPRFADTTVGRTRGRHEWWVELRSPGAARLNAEDMAAGIDRELQRLNEDYEAKRQGGGLERPLVRIVPEGTFERWLKGRGQWGGQHKMPRCRSDRLIADEFAGALAGR